MAAFVTGGFVPQELRGTHSALQMHIVVSLLGNPPTTT